VKRTLALVGTFGERGARARSDKSNVEIHLSGLGLLAADLDKVKDNNEKLRVPMAPRSCNIANSGESGKLTQSY
jgi:hypothetical protein